ncbi:unnamed protein product [Adineta ricciae]|uniref:Uncharacterized protein n=1 Tax=Adineta ricciae TaxID=249248 RepID=A0A815X6R9_ADIRI|nr:unnamed protein product [Adineta ricciae]
MVKISARSALSYSSSGKRQKEGDTLNADRVFIHRLGPKTIPAWEMNAIYRKNTQKIGSLIGEEDDLRHCIKLIEQQLKQ